MDYGIIVDSCCDMTNQIKERLGLVKVPLTLRLGEREFLDDEGLDIPNFMTQMKACKEKVGSAAPSPRAYQKAMVEMGRSFVVTLSSRLSGSHASALMGKSFAEEAEGVETHVFDSKSASAGQLLIAYRIYDLLCKEEGREQIIQKINQMIKTMKTYFVLENYDNLQKNGRLGRVKGKIANILNLKLVMGSDGDGNIALYAKPRGTKQMIAKLLHLVQESGKKPEEECLVISHCDNPDLAQELKSAIEQQFSFREILVVPTGGLSSLYADEKGIVLAF